jgi:hypothetical protein
MHKPVEGARRFLRVILIVVVLRIFRFVMGFFFLSVICLQATRLQSSHCCLGAIRSIC